MITHYRAILLMLAAALSGCSGGAAVDETPANDPAPPVPVRAEPAPPPAALPEPPPADMVAAAQEEPADPPGTAAPSLVIQHMPAQCDDARFYLNTSRLMTPEMESALGGFVSTAVSDVGGGRSKTDAKKVAATLKVLKDGGLDPVSSIDELAVCANPSQKSVAAVAYDMSKAKKPADVWAKAMTTATGKKPVRAEVDGVVYLQAKEDDPWVAVVGKDRLVIGDTKESTMLAVKGGNGGDRGFAGASRHVLWLKVDDKKIELKVRDAGDSLSFALRAGLGNEASRAVEEFEKVRLQLDKFAQKVPALTPLLPAAKSARVSAANGVLSASGDVTKSALAQCLTRLQGQKLQDLMRNL